MNALNFQDTAITQLLENTKKLIKIDSSSFEETPCIILKAPTGSGKTFICESFINRLGAEPDFTQDAAFIWMTCSETLALQSRDKFREYFNPNLNCRLLTATDIEQNEKLLQNDILFSNWQKYNIAREKIDQRTLRRPNDERKFKESGYYFDDIIENTKKDNRKIILIIDESHAYDSPQAKETVTKIIAPSLIIKISATPFNTKSEENEFLADIVRGKNALVEVKREDVISEGLIKQSIISQTEEDILNYKVPDEDIEKLLLTLAIEKQKEIRTEWNRLGFDINPLIMIQLPNDSKTKVANEIESKKTRILQILKELGVSDDKIATRLQETSEHMEDITKNNSKIDFLLFKLAAATGWDCPRAHILVRYREIKSESFEVQTLGRILRMPVVDKNFNNQLLQTGYLYTNFPKSSVHIPDETDKNKAKVNHTQLNVQIKKEILKNDIAACVENVFSNLDENDELKTALKDAAMELSTAAQSVKTEFDKAVESLIFVPQNEKNDFEKIEKVRTENEAKSNQLKKVAESEIQKIIEKVPEQHKQFVQVHLEKKLNEVIQKAQDVALGQKETEIVLDSFLKSDFLSRADYGDLGKVSVFRKNFIASMNKFFGIDLNKLYSNDELDKKLTEKGVVLDKSLKTEMMVDVVYKSEENQNNETGKNIEHEISQNNVEVAFTEMCYEILTTQTEEDAKVGNVARSWSAFRQTLVLWLKKYAFPGYDYLDSYKIFLNDCNKACVFRAAITQGLKEYKSVLNEYIAARENAACVSLPFTIKTHYSYTDDYEIFENASRSFVRPFYLKKEYNGRDNEINFIEYLEISPNVKHWFKNGDNGKEFLAFKYFDSTENRNRLFYPDWLVELDDGRICILDTKGGITASSTETKEKAEELQRRIAELNKHSSKKYFGGIVIKANGIWYINCNNIYEYHKDNLQGWKTLSWKEL